MTEWEDAQHAAQNVLIQACPHPAFVPVNGRGLYCIRCGGEVAVLLRPRRATPPELDPNRCAVCGWPLDPLGQLCARGNCSQRPLPDRFYDPARARREYAPYLDNDPRAQSAMSNPHSVGPSRAGAPHEHEESTNSEVSLRSEPMVPPLQDVDSSRVDMPAQASQVGPVRVPGLDPLAEVARLLAAWRARMADHQRASDGEAWVETIDTLERCINELDEVVRRLRPASPVPEASTSRTSSGAPE